MSFWFAWTAVIVGMAVGMLIVIGVLKGLNKTYEWIYRKYGYKYADHFTLAVIILPILLTMSVIIAGTIQSDYNSKHRAPTESVRQ